ncbi:MAG: hypothetical protein Q6K14_07465 [Gloeomargarita sp. GMQP_bins_44]
MDINALLEQPVPGDYFAPGAYVQGDLELGTLSNRRGNRLLAIPQWLVQGIYRGLEREIGKASPLVLQRWGRHWGRHLFARLAEELAEYYGKPIGELTMQELVYCLTRCWQVHGWGRLTLDWRYRPQGLIHGQVENSPWGNVHVEMGVLETLFQQLTGREVACVAIACMSQGQPANQYLIGLPERLETVREQVAAGMEAATILARLGE